MAGKPAKKQFSKSKSKPTQKPHSSPKQESFKNRSNSTPKLKSNHKPRFKSSNPSSSFGHQNDQTPQNPNTLVQKSALLSMSPSDQLSQIKQIHNKILLSPQDNIKHIQTIFTLTKIANLQIVSTALRVLAQIFVNVAPLEAIDLEKIKERSENIVKKEEYKVIRFQQILVEQYQRYIRMLKEINGKIKVDNFGNDQEVFREFKKCLLECVVKIYRTLWNFNYTKEVNELCLKFIKFQECRNFLKEMLMDKNVAVLGAKSKIIGGIARIIKNQDFQKKLPADIIKIINCTHIDTRYLKKDQQALDYKKKRLKKKLYRQQALQAKKQKEKKAQSGTLQMKRKKREEKAKQKLRVREQVNKQFAQSHSTPQSKTLTHHNSQILQQLFYIYFKILLSSFSNASTPFLRDTLDGILKFVHLINIDLTKSLLSHLDQAAALFRQQWRIGKKERDLQIRVMIIFTGESIVNGPLSVYCMDDGKIVGHFYRLMRDVNEKGVRVGKELYRLLGVTLEEIFVKRRQLSQEVVASFAREIAIFLKQKENLPKLYMLELIRVLVYKYGKLARMFQEDNEGFGINSFNPICEDPQVTNAINTDITPFLKAIKSKKSKEYQQNIDRIVDKLCRQNFLQKDIKQSLYSMLQKQMEDPNF